ncbi:MAG: aspartate aminotransferase family protein [Flavobacteriales bacterium]|jgi:acetylornithine/N-succinyldiaminopimelate aminotransferase|nr:aspartate aminotransferase family protein [bacterium]MDG1174453.1 aspartate aminotransferase family protein [Flavobacteriales bacterium]
MDNKEIFHTLQAQTTPFPIGLEISRAEGLFIYDKAGKAYYDLVSGLAVTNIGHRHPKVIEAIKKQLDIHLHVMPYGEFIQTPQLELAKKLNEILPANLTTSYFVNSGAEAVEGALKLAKRYTGRQEIIACHKSYHGSTHGALSVSGNPVKQSAFKPLLPDVHFIEFNDLAELNKITTKTACVIIETVQGDAGVRIPDLCYLQKLREKCTETGTLLILDEIQTGFGRTGSFFAFEQYGITPDILVIAKALGGGMPIGAFVSSKKIMDCLTHNPMLGHITTFGGHPVNCAAAIANIKVIQEENLIVDVHEKGALMNQLLSHSLVKEIRQIGLMLAIDLENEEITQQVVEGCMEKGIIAFWFLSCPASFRLAPPLTITLEEIETVCGVICKVFDGVKS